MKRVLYLLLFFLTLLPQLGYGQPRHYEEAVVGQIRVVDAVPSGAKVPSNTILSKMLTKEGNLFSQKDFDIDLKTLSRDFDRIEPTLSLQEDQLDIELKVWPKPLVYQISWEGNEHVPSARLKKELGMSVGSTFDRETFHKGLNKVKHYYVTHGYFEVEVLPELTFDETGQQVAMVIHIKEGRAGKIEKISFEGFTKEEKQSLLALISTKPYSLFTSWFLDTGVYQEDGVEHDKLVILNFLHNKGYADAQVEIRVEPSKKNKNRIVLRVHADKGQVYHIGSVSFSGNAIFDDATIQKWLLVAEGQPYSPDKIHETVRSITDFYGARGYIEALVVYETSLRHEEPTYDLHFSIEEGAPYKIGLIKIFGNSYTQNRVILHESLLIPGQVFDLRKLKATEERIHNIGYFKNVNVYPVRSQDAEFLGSNYRDVHIEVEEASTGSFMLFSGFSTASNLFGGIEFLERNFNYKGLFHLFSEGPKAIRGAGEYLRFKASVASKSNSFVLSWTKPYFHDTKWTVGFDLEKGMDHQQSKDYRVNSQGVTLHATYPYNSYVRFPVHYRLVETRTHVGDNASVEEKEQAKSSGVISAIGAGIAYDSTNHPYFPTNGLLSRASVEFSGLGGDFDFFKLSYHNTLYTKISSRGVWKTRVDMNFIQPTGTTNAVDIPMGERLFLGGLGSVRGYRTYSLGPKFLGTNSPKGGMSSTLGSTEYNHKLFQMLSAFAFCDVGSLSSHQWQFGPYVASVGFGVRFDLLKQFPLIIGMGYPVGAEDESNIHRFFLSVGGRF